MKKVKRMFSMIMVLAMLFSCLGLSSFAAGDGGAESQEQASTWSGDDFSYLTKFSSEKSVLAPGISQEINMAITADGKQMRYYIATADITSEYVNVYANYNNNDPAAGWALSLVRAQAAAAQAKYSDPNSEYYIENYTIVAAINGAGYNMNTGEPGGLLVMGGVEYHAPNNAGFFGILDDGSAYIGTTEEYNTIYKDRVMEGIAGFGTFLIRDGQIVVSHSDNYTNERHSRTAVGITADGQVVFMVLDGRQEPVSCGGSYQEIAQIMLEAGCVEAVNLDGGGSTTYLAKQEGQDELSLVNSPSDGVERSVSTSLIMVSTAPNSTEFHHASISADNKYMTVGTSVQLTAAGVSAMGGSAQLPEGTSWAVSDSSIGSVSASGVFTAAKPGDVEVRLMHNGAAVGSLVLHVVQPDSVSFTKDYIDALYGQTVELPLSLSYQGNEVAFTAADVTFTMSSASAGSLSGLSFTGSAESGIKQLSLAASLASNAEVSDEVVINLYGGTEIPFDFENATGGDRALAWSRDISNSNMDNELDENISFRVVDTSQAMVSDYDFGIDLSQMPIGAELAAALAGLGGSVDDSASGWELLLGAADKISGATNLSFALSIDGNFDVDISGLAVECELFSLGEAKLDGNELTISLKWNECTAALKAEEVSTLCKISGIKLTPKADAAWDSQSRLTVTNSGTLGYTLYVKEAAAAQSSGLSSGSGTGFTGVCAGFSDSYTMINALKNGWFNEDAGYAYYVDGVKLTGVQKVEGYYYDFGEDGLNVGKTKFTGLFQIDGVNHYALAGSLVSGWVNIGEDSYYFGEDYAAYDGTVIMDEVELIFDNGLLIGGHDGFITKSDGKTYHYVNGKQTFSWYYNEAEGYWYHFDAVTGVMTTGTKVMPDAEARSKNAYYDFADDGKLLRAYFNPAGYYYWAGVALKDSWVKNGADSDPEAWYRTNGSGHFVTDPTGNYTKEMTIDGVSYTTVTITIDGVSYTFNNANGKLLLGSVKNIDGKIYYYWAGEAINDGWFTINGETRYAYADGHLARGTVSIDGETYVFDNTGVLKSQGGDLTANVGEDGVMTITYVNSGLNNVRFAVWSSQTGQSDSLVWVNASKDDDGNWVASLSMCTFGVEGEFVIHAYSVGVGGQSFLGDLYIELSDIGHVYDDMYDLICNACGHERPIPSVPMFRMYDPNSGEHFYTGSERERDFLVSNGWHYEGVAFNFPVIGDPVYRLYNPVSGDHLYTMDLEEREELLANGWNDEGVAFNSATDDCVPQYRLWNPNAVRGAWHFTGSERERDFLMGLGWQYQGIGWYSMLQ